MGGSIIFSSVFLLKRLTLNKKKKSFCEKLVKMQNSVGKWGDFMHLDIVHTGLWLVPYQIMPTISLY